ncbi:MAG: glycosyltransferase family 2 protein [Pseudomonadota bacterium]|nr:glycosyltransferase family 2 protein [Pseudomonadota bacterium]
MPTTSIIVTTYNRPDALARVLWALAAQTQQDFEVIIADDGSTPMTRALIQALRPQLPYPLKHFWQEDKGFRAARARNQALALTAGSYLIFLDGDCVPRTDFVAQHHHLAEIGWFVVGQRILLSERFTAQILKPLTPTGRLQQQRDNIGAWSVHHWLKPYLRQDINRLLPLLPLPYPFRKRRPQQWQGAQTCNLGVWHQDIVNINGFNEAFQGWGHEDAELVVRLVRQNIRRKEGRFALPVFHLWHPLESRDNERLNRYRLEQHLSNSSSVT